MKTLNGKVISNKMMNTVVVEVEHFMAHKLYSKRILKSKKFHADNQLGAKTGNLVEIVETRPISKTKTWKVTKIIK
jgi:small subunit ribosomal protein S17